MSAPERPLSYDISPLVSPRTAVFPGDTPFSRDVALSFERGHHLALSSIRTTVHAGAHADAPSHYDARGASIEVRPLDLYVGPCQVVRVRLQRGERVRPEHLAGVELRTSRVLIATGSFPDPDHWNNDFNALTPELIHFLAERGVRLVGIDTPSIDLADDKVLSTHHAVYARDMAVLEGIVLDDVPEGTYTLVALPLKLEGADASPVRAALFTRLPER